MQTEVQFTQVSKKMFWAGRVVSAIPVLILVMSGIMKFVKPPALIDEMSQMGWDMNMATGLGILELVCTVLYLIPQTSVLGAILLTGYLGGATAAHVRVGDQFFVTVIFGILIWLGLYLREPRLRSLIPRRS
jgi:uncharacterized membrane protein YphA (DoxX/SURF4 family)